MGRRAERKQRNRDTVANGGTMSGSDARKVTSSGGGFVDGRVVHQGQVVADYRNRKLKDPGSPHIQ